MNKDVKGKKLVVIDGKSVFYRGFYGMPYLRTTKGVPTGGVFGFASIALEIIKDIEPDYVAVAWDKSKTNIRKRREIYPEYKAGRKPPPKEFYEQIPLLRGFLEALGWPLYELDDYEADDIMGALALQASKQDINTILLTSDLDLLQVIGPKTHVYAIKKGSSGIYEYNPKTFEDKYGIKVSQFLDFKALKGDGSDNIPGVPGIGDKTAKELLLTYGNIDNIYENIELIKDSTKKKLEAGRELSKISKTLAEIWTDAPIKLNLEEVDGSNMDPKKVVEVLKDLEFKTLARHFPEIIRTAVDDEVAKSMVPGKDFNNKTITDDDALKSINIDFEKPTLIFTRSLGTHGKEPKCLVISDGGKDVFSIDATKINKITLLEFLGRIKSIIGHDTKATLKVFLEFGLKPKVAFDILIVDFLLFPLNKNQDLTSIYKNQIDGNEQVDINNLDNDEILSYGNKIIAMISALYTSYSKSLTAEPKLKILAENVEFRVIEVLSSMEKIGIELDKDYMNQFKLEVEDLISDLQQNIYGQADKEFNIDSPSQLSEILFNELKLPTVGVKKGKTGFSTAANQLDKLIELHPIVGLIKEYREVAKLKNTYIDTLPKQTDEHSRIHTTFNLTVASTGRLSSSDPNLQNIPTRTDLGRRIRSAFVASSGKLFLSADYSQFELRIAAVLAEDTELIGMFNKGEDIHTQTAALVYERQPEDVTKQMRRAAKAINFGILYGMSGHGLVQATGMTRHQADNFIDRYKQIRKPLFDYTEKVKLETRQKGYSETLFGRKRPFPDINSSNYILRSAAERGTINMPIQGTEADLMKMAMIQVDNLKSDYDFDVILQIHDSILLECKPGDEKIIASKVQETMENVYDLGVKLDVDVTFGENWGQL